MKEENKKYIYFSHAVTCLILWLILNRVVISLFDLINYLFESEIENTEVLSFISLSHISALGLSVLAFFMLVRSKKINVFLEDVIVELKKVEWPRKPGADIPFKDRYQELIDSTVVVLVSIVILACFIGMVDFLYSKLAKIFFY